MLADDRLETVQRLFRSANERLSELALDLGADGNLVPYLCECADTDCLARVAMTAGEYTELRKLGDIYVILVDHPIAESLVAERHDGYNLARVAN